jgi:imidazolonepropionase-like amidohydrolase
MPGFRRFSDVEKHPASAFEISDADAKRAALQGTCVVTTLGGARALAPDQKREQDDFNMRNLRMLLRHHVKLALGSDSYGEDTIPEAIYISSLHAMDNRTLLKLWTTSTAQTIFPGRKIGKLQQAYEANFLVLRANPLDNFEAVQDIAVAVKQGVVLELTRSSKPAPQSGAICGNYSAGASVWPSCDHENIWESLK